MKTYILRFCSLFALLSVLLLAGCGKKVSASDPAPVSASAPASATVEPEPMPVPTPVPTPTPTPTPTYDLDFSIGDQKISASMTSLDLSQATSSAGKQRPSSLRQEYLREEMPDDYVKMTAPPFAGAEDMPCQSMSYEEEDEAYEELERKIRERMEHMSDSFSKYLLFLIGQKGLKNADVYKSAIVDKKVFSKLKTNPGYHPDKSTALRLCVGARLNMDETRDLLSRAGYALSPCDKTDIIFSFFIENGIYNMIEIDIQLEEHGLPCIIT